jgi:hypothetical protein
MRAGPDPQLADGEAQALLVMTQALELEMLADRHERQPIASTAPWIYG